MDRGYEYEREKYYSHNHYPHHPNGRDHKYPHQPHGGDVRYSNNGPVSMSMARQPQGPQPEDGLIFAIFVTLCCCLPFGVLAIIKSLDVRSRYLAGDMEGAQDASKASRRWSMIGLITGIVVDVLGVIVVAVVYFVVFSNLLDSVSSELA